MNSNYAVIYPSHLIVLLIISFINPAAGVIFAFLYVNRNRRLSKGAIMLFIIAVSIFLGYINSTKIASSDTIHYLNWFEQVDRAHPIHSFLHYRGEYSINEPAFAILSILFNYITLGNAEGYLFLCTFFIYILQFYALYLVCNKFDVSPKVTILLILLLAFYNPLFLQTIHGLRQMLATAILMLAIARRVISGKNNWILLLWALLTHTSVLAYIPFVAFSFFYQKLSFSRTIIISVLSILFFYFYNQLGGIFQSSGIEYISEVGNKLADVSKNNQMDLALRGFYMYNIPFFAITLFSIFSPKNKYGEMTVYYVLYIVTCIVVVANPISTEVSIRYAFFVCSFFPYCFLALDLANKNVSNLVLPVITLLIVLIFFYLLAGDPQYPGIFILLFKPFPFIL